MLGGGNPSLLSSPPPPLLNALSHFFEKAAALPWAEPPLCPTLSSFFRLASLPTWPTPAPDLTSPFQGDHRLLTLKGSCLLLQGKAGGELGWHLSQQCHTACFPINHHFRVPFRVLVMTDEEPGGARTSYLIPLKPEGTVSLFHAWAWGWWRTEHLVCPTYRVCKAWASCFLNAEMFICTVALVDFPGLMMLLSYLGSLLGTPEGWFHSLTSWSPGICSSQHIWGDSEAAGALGWHLETTGLCHDSGSISEMSWS